MGRNNLYKEFKNIWQADWGNPFQLKFFVFFDHEEGIWKKKAHTTTEVPDVKYMDQKSAEAVVQKCNSRTPLSL